MFKCVFGKRKVVAIVAKRMSILTIDTGTVNSYMAIVENNAPKVLENAEGTRLNPFYLSYDENGLENTGLSAYKQAVTNKENTFFYPNFFLGRSSLDDIKRAKEQKSFPFKFDIVDGKVIFTSTVKEEAVLPTRVIEANMAALVDLASSHIGKRPRKLMLVIQDERFEELSKIYREAAKSVNLEVVKCIPETEAVCLGYGIDTEEPSKFVHFSMSGLTTSIQLVEYNPEAATKFEVKTVLKKDFLGGEAIDGAIVDYFLKEFETKNKKDIRGEGYAMQKLKDAAETAKKELSSQASAEINLPYLTADATGPKHLNISLQRSKFNMVVDKKLVEIENLIKEFKKTADLTGVTEVILSGGSTRIPLIQDTLKNLLGLKIRKLVNPEEVAISGAAMLSSSIKLDDSEIKYIDKAPLSIGIETLGGRFDRLIEKDAVLPVKKSFKVQSVADNQTKVEFKFYMGEREIAAENKLVAELPFSLPIGNKKEVQISLEVKLSNNGMFAVSVFEENSKKKASFHLIRLFDVNCERLVVGPG